MLKASEVTRDLTAARVARALRRHVGRGKEYGYAEFAEVTGQDQRTVEAHCRAESAPHLFVWLRYAAILPPVFAADLLEIVGLTGLHDAETGDAHPASLLVNVCGMSAMLSRHMADGKQDHRERAEAEPAMRELRAMLDAYLGDGCPRDVPVKGVAR